MSDAFVYLPEFVPIFPLPEVVLFPRTILPLHVFEPRYREMMADALAGERLLAIALLKAGYEPLYYTRRAPIHATVGVGQILESEKLADGNYNLLLRGLGRATVVSEIPDRPYRLARLEVLETFCSASQAESERLRRRLFASIRGNPGLDRDLRSHWLRLAKVELPLGELADLIAAGLPVEAELRQCLLDEPDAFARAQMLRDQLRTLASIARASRRAAQPGRQNLN